MLKLIARFVGIIIGIIVGVVVGLRLRWTRKQVTWAQVALPSQKVPFEKLEIGTVFYVAGLVVYPTFVIGFKGIGNRWYYIEPTWWAPPGVTFNPINIYSPQKAQDPSVEVEVISKIPFVYAILILGTPPAMNRQTSSQSSAGR